MWCENKLLVIGDTLAIEHFRRQNRGVIHPVGSAPIPVPLLFGALLPRPPVLDVEENEDALNVYQALYGDWKQAAASMNLRNSFQDREALVQHLKETHANLVELAERYRRNEETTGFRNWYEWNLEHFGTKWDLGPDTTGGYFGPGCYVYTFRTWEHPPLPWFELLVGAYRMVVLKLRYLRPQEGADWEELGSVELARAG